MKAVTIPFSMSYTGQVLACRGGHCTSRGGKGGHTLFTTKTDKPSTAFLMVHLLQEIQRLCRYRAPWGEGYLCVQVKLY